MQKTFCDACGHEINGRANSFEPLTHIVEYAEGRLSGYVDKDGHAVSGRSEHFDLCNGCYINVYTAAYRVIKLTQETVQQKGG